MKKTKLFILANLLAAFLTAAAFAEVTPEVLNQILSTKDEAVLIGFLTRPIQSDDDFYCASVACKQLTRIGTSRAVPALAAMLPSEKLNQYARLALEVIPGPEAEKALFDAAGNCTGQPQANAIESLGKRNSTLCLPIAIKTLSTTDCPCVRKACIEALGRNGSEEAVAALLDFRARWKDAPVLENAYPPGLLLAADVCLKDGRTETALRIYDALAKEPFDAPQRRAGLYHAMLLRKTEALPQILAFLKSENQDEREVALRVIHELDPASGLAVSRAVLENLAEFSPEMRRLAVQAVAERRDTESAALALPEIQKIWDSADSDPASKICALKILTRAQAAIGNPVEMLEKLLALQVPEADKALESARLAACVALEGKEVDEKILALLRELAEKPVENVLYARLVATVAEERMMFEASPLLLNLTEKQYANQPVRDRAISAAATLISVEEYPRFIELVDGLPHDFQIELLYQKSAAHLPADAVAEQLKNAAKPEAKARLLGILKLIGGPKALVVLASACADPETVDAATKILGEWNDPGTMEALADVSLKLAKNPQIEEKFRIRALRSFLRVPRQFDLPIPKKLEMCRAGFETAWRNEEKLLIFDVFSRAIHPDTIEAAAQYVQYDFCREAACQSIVTVAKELKSKSPKSAEILAQIAEKTTDPELAKQARALAEALK